MDMFIGFAIGVLCALYVWLAATAIYQNTAIKQCQRQSGGECVFIGWEPAP